MGKPGVFFINNERHVEPGYDEECLNGNASMNQAKRMTGYMPKKYRESQNQSKRAQIIITFVDGSVASREAAKVLNKT